MRAQVSGKWNQRFKQRLMNNAIFWSLLAIGLIGTTNSAFGSVAAYEPIFKDSGGNLITTIGPNQSFTLEMTVQDLRPDPAGVFAGVACLMFDPMSVMMVGDINHQSPYVNATFGMAMPGRIENGGGLAGPNVLDGQRYVTYSIDMMSGSSPGQIEFFTMPAEDQVQFGTLLFNVDHVIDPSEIDFRSGTLQVVPEASGLTIALPALLLGLGWRRRRRSTSQN